MKEPTMTKAQLAELAGKIGAELGMTIDHEWDSWGVMLGAESDGLHISEPYDRPGYLSINGRFPRTSYSFRKGDRLSIHVRADRGAAVIAKEVTRRLMPGYRAALAKMREHDAAGQADTRARQTLSALITGLFPDGVARLPSHCQSERGTQVNVSLKGLQGGWVKFHGDGREVEFERFRVPADVALRMLDVVALLS